MNWWEDFTIRCFCESCNISLSHEEKNILSWAGHHAAAMHRAHLVESGYCLACSTQASEFRRFRANEGGV